MQMENFLRSILSKKGQIVTFTTERPVKVKKGSPTILKQSEFQARIGVNYDNIKAVQEARQTGEKPAENAGLPWGTWKEFPYVITHNGNDYIRCTKVDSGNNKPATYTVDGEEIGFEMVKKYALASELKPSDGEVFNIKVESIVDFK